MREYKTVSVKKKKWKQNIEVKLKAVTWKWKTEEKTGRGCKKRRRIIIGE